MKHLNYLYSSDGSLTEEQVVQFSKEDIICATRSFFSILMLSFFLLVIEVTSLDFSTVICKSVLEYWFFFKFLFFYHIQVIQTCSYDVPMMLLWFCRYGINVESFFDLLLIFSLYCVATYKAWGLIKVSMY